MGCIEWEPPVLLIPEPKARGLAKSTMFTNDSCILPSTLSNISETNGPISNLNFI